MDDHRIRIVHADQDEPVLDVRITAPGLPDEGESLRMQVEPDEGMSVRFEGTVQKRTFGMSFEAHPMGDRRSSEVSLWVAFDRFEVKDVPYHLLDDRPVQNWTPPRGGAARRRHRQRRLVLSKSHDLGDPSLSARASR